VKHHGGGIISAAWRYRVNGYHSARNGGVSAPWRLKSRLISEMAEMSGMEKPLACGSA